MTKDAIEEIVACLPEGRTPFYYFLDRYALMILGLVVGDGMPIHVLKSSPYGKLLHKPIVKELIGRVGSGILTRSALESVWPHNSECYLLTLGTWGPKRRSRYGNWTHQYYQLSRPGLNLVLQLNFSSKHDRSYQSLIRPQARHPFEDRGHPIAAERDKRTLAWARMDIDLETGTALIEEVQSDWVRLAMDRRTTLEVLTEDERGETTVQTAYMSAGYASRKTLKTYQERILKPHLKVWDEAILSASIWFLRAELGIRRIYYHTFETGLQLKKMYGGRPPRSLYTTLPRRFGFQETDVAPAFLASIVEKRFPASAFRGATLPRFFLLDL